METTPATGCRGRRGDSGFSRCGGVDRLFVGTTGMKASNPMTPARFKKITDGYASLRVAIAGDFCLDRYLEIDPAKKEVSIETGLEVHNVVRVRAQPGGAGTVL